MKEDPTEDFQYAYHEPESYLSISISVRHITGCDSHLPRLVGKDPPVNNNVQEVANGTTGKQFGFCGLHGSWCGLLEHKRHKKIYMSCRTTLSFFRKTPLNPKTEPLKRLKKSTSWPLSRKEIVVRMPPWYPVGGIEQRSSGGERASIQKNILRHWINALSDALI